MMKRIYVVGASGCGKNTLAHTLSKKLNIPYFDLDDYHHLPGWQQRDPEEFINIVNDITEGNKWIVSGNYYGVGEVICKKCDTVIWLDYSIWRCLYQVGYRSLRRIINKELCCNGNYETWNTFFSKYNMLLWILTTFKKRKLAYGKIFKNQDKAKQYFRFSTPEETRLWIDQQG